MYGRYTVVTPGYSRDIRYVYENAYVFPSDSGALHVLVKSAEGEELVAIYAAGQWKNVYRTVDGHGHDVMSTT